MKRFWKAAAAVNVEDGWRIQLDSRPMRLPTGESLLLRHEKLAHAVAFEWQNAGGGEVGGDVKIESLPLTGLAATAEIRIRPDRGQTRDAIARYGETDLLCYRAISPQNLVQRQSDLWQPWVEWAREAFSAPLEVTSGIIHIKQKPQSLAALSAPLMRYDDYQLTMLSVIVPIFGSLVLGLAVAQGALLAQEALSLSLLDEIFAAEQWGEDPQILARHAGLGRDVIDAARFARICAGDAGTVTAG